MSDALFPSNPETVPVRPEHLTEGMIVRIPDQTEPPPEGILRVDLRAGLDGGTVWEVERFLHAFGPDTFRVEFSDRLAVLWIGEDETIEVEC